MPSVTSAPVLKKAIWSTMNMEEKLGLEVIKAQKEQLHIQAEILSLYKSKDLEDILATKTKMVGERLENRQKDAEKQRVTSRTSRS